MAVAYIFACEAADEIRALDASAFFAQFPNFDTIQAQWVSETQQSAASLTAEEPVLSFR
jgi:hypothetical protein